MTTIWEILPRSKWGLMDGADRKFMADVLENVKRVEKTFFKIDPALEALTHDTDGIPSASQLAKVQKVMVKDIARVIGSEIQSANRQLKSSCVLSDRVASALTDSKVSEILIKDLEDKGYSIDVREAANDYEEHGEAPKKIYTVSW